MLITRKSMVSGVERTLDVPCTEEQFKKYEQGVSIQFAMPNVSDDDREFILTGITPDEWESLFEEK